MSTAVSHTELMFRIELARLLKKFNAEIVITDDGKPWGLHSGVCKVTCVENGNVVEFDL